jgi:hypothetical protein
MRTLHMHAHIRSLAVLTSHSFQEDLAAAVKSDAAKTAELRL